MSSANQAIPSQWTTDPGPLRTHPLPNPRCNILLVDDRPENLVALKSVLADLNQNLVTASSGVEALRCLLHDDYAVILLDVQMPGMDGFETAELIRLRERTQHTPIVFLTAINKTESHVSRGYSVGAADYVFKPFDPEILKAKVSAFVELSRKTIALRQEIEQREAAEAELDRSNALLQVISQGLAGFLETPIPERTFEFLLRQVVELTQSEYGFVVLRGKDRTPQVVAAVNGPQGRAPLDLYRTDAEGVIRAYGLQNLLSSGNGTGAGEPSTLIADQVRPGVLPDSHPAVYSFAAMPFRLGGAPAGLVTLCNRDSGYGTDMVRYLEPLLSTCASIVAAHRNDMRRKRAEDKVRQLNEDLEQRVATRTAELEQANEILEQEISERKRAQEDLGRKQEQIQALNERLQRAMTETHHRVKNNLQIIAAMVDMRLLDGSPTVSTEEIRRLGSYVRTMAAVHEILTQQAKEDGEAHVISASDVLEKLIPMLQEAAEGRRLHATIEDALLSARQGTSLALVTNELVSNALKHGKGDVCITLSVHENIAVLSVCDDGPGFPEGFHPAVAANTGLELVENLSRWDLGGQVSFANGAQGGAEVTVTVPVSTA